MKKKHERDIDAALDAAARAAREGRVAPPAAHQWVCSMCGRRSAAATPTNQRPRCSICGGTTLLEESH